MKTARKISAATLPLNRCCLVVDGNAHRSDLCLATLPVSDGMLVSEAMLPQIRTVAVMIAAMRHDFGRPSPDCFTEEADWFAARILVLRVRRFHLDITLVPMLQEANRRARRFAALHGLDFAPAAIRMSLHAKRPDNLLIAETQMPTAATGDMLADSRRLAAQLAERCKLFQTGAASAV